MSFNQPLFQLDVYSHGFRVSRFNQHVRDVCAAFARRYAQWGLVPAGRGRFERRITKVFAAATKMRDEYFFHRACLDEFLEHCRANHLNPALATRVDHPLYQGDAVGFRWVSPKQPRELQLVASEFFMQPEPVIKVLTAQTGAGKGLTSLWFVKEYGQRTAIVVKGMYLDKWKNEIIEMLGLPAGELLVVRGSKSLKSLIDMFTHHTAESKKVKMILISASTYRNYMDTYFEYGRSMAKSGYGCVPMEFFQKLGIGIRLIDEVHQFFHFNFTMDCVTHVPKSVSMSATLESGDRFIDKLYALIFPEKTRAPTPEWQRYIDVNVIMYRFANPTLIRFTNVMKQYSQTEFEKSIMRYPIVLKNYINMICELAYNRFIDGRAPGQKLAIFCGLKDMVEKVVAALKVRYHDLKVGRFVDVDPDSVLLESDIIVTTLQSCGTARDIPGLRVVINTIGLNKMDANQQLIGRLRQLRDWPDITPEFIYIGDRENQKHMGYLQELPTKLKGKIRHLNQMTSSWVI